MPGSSPPLLAAAASCSRNRSGLHRNSFISEYIIWIWRSMTMPLRTHIFDRTCAWVARHDSGACSTTLQRKAGGSTPCHSGRGRGLNAHTKRNGEQAVEGPVDKRSGLKLVHTEPMMAKSWGYSGDEVGEGQGLVGAGEEEACGAASAVDWRGGGGCTC
jgi:hypothetical protein